MLSPAISGALRSIGHLGYPSSLESPRISLASHSISSAFHVAPATYSPASILFPFSLHDSPSLTLSSSSSSLSSSLPHPPLIYPEVLKLALLSSPSCASTLFDESELSKFISLAGQSSSFQSQQAIVDIASSALRRPRSPRRFPARSPHSSSYGSSRSKSPKSPSRSPKRVRFSGTPPPSSSSKSSLKKKKNFQK